MAGVKKMLSIGYHEVYTTNTLIHVLIFQSFEEKLDHLCNMQMSVIAQEMLQGCRYG